MSESSGIIMPRRTLITDLGWSGPVAAAASIINIILTSPNDFSNGAWVPDGDSVTATNVLAPDSTNTASALAPFNTSASGIGNTSFGPLTVGQQYRLTGYLQWIEDGNWGLLDVSDGVNAFYQWFDFKNGTVGSTQTAGAGAVDSGTITAAGNGYFKCSVVGHLTTTNGSAVTCGTYKSNADNTFNCTIPSSHNVWGFGTVP